MPKGEKTENKTRQEVTIMNIENMETTQQMKVN